MCVCGCGCVSSGVDVCGIVRRSEVDCGQTYVVGRLVIRLMRVCGVVFALCVSLLVLMSMLSSVECLLVSLR